MAGEGLEAQIASNSPFSVLILAAPCNSNRQKGFGIRAFGESAQGASSLQALTFGGSSHDKWGAGWHNPAIQIASLSAKNAAG